MKVKFYFFISIIFIISSHSINAQTHKIDSLYLYNWSNGLNNWDTNNFTKELFTYNNKGAKETKLLRLNGDGTTWVNFYQFDKTYDTNNNLLKNSQQNWDSSTSSWIDMHKYEYQFDVSNNEIEDIHSLFYSSVWNLSTKSNSTYGSDGVVSKISQTYSGGSFVNNKKYSYSYENAKVDTLLTQKWDSPTSFWQNEERTIYTYTGSLVTGEDVIRYNIGNGNWNNYIFTKYTYTYNADGNILTSVKQLWNASAGELKDVEKNFHSYTNGNLTELINEECSISTGICTNNFRYTQTFDSNNNITEKIFDDWITATNSWKGTLKWVYFLSDVHAFSLHVDFQKTTNSTIYPNPIKDVLHLSFSSPIKENTSIEVYDLNSKLVLKKQLQKNSSVINIPFQKQAKGIYFVRIYENSKVETFKVIKQ